MNCDADILRTKKQNELRFLKVRFISFGGERGIRSCILQNISDSFICYVLQNTSVIVQKRSPGAFFRWVRIPSIFSTKTKKHPLRRMLFILAEREGFEPSWDCSQTDFESAPLWPLRYLSMLDLEKEKQISFCAFTVYHKSPEIAIPFYIFAQLISLKSWSQCISIRKTTFLLWYRWAT